MSNIDFRKRFTLSRPYSSHSDTDSLPELRSLQRAYESDRGRIINSAAIRRLQQKTQVFALERNAAVRSRLTHSMEVQQTGRFITQRIFELLENDADQFGLNGLERCVESLVEMSCLMHDVGNPPFGHFGEAAISDWFCGHIEMFAAEFAQQYPSLTQDICHFEGNAQAIRLMHSLLGLNLTYSQLAGVLKYTRAGDMLKSTIPEAQNYLMKKVGYYASERNFVLELWRQLNMDANCRHPLSYIMEAADDISYCLADIEDAVEKGIITLAVLQQSLCAEFLTQCNQLQLSSQYHHTMQSAVDTAMKRSSQLDNNQTSQFFTFLRVKLIHPLVDHAATEFVSNIESIYRGSLNRALLEDGGLCHAITATLKNVAINKVFSHREVEKLELQGYRIISGLLESYAPLLKLSNADFKGLVEGNQRMPLIAARLLHRLPKKHLATYRQATKNDNQSELPEFYHRCRLIQDYISGMTDQFAQDEYRMLNALD